MNWFQIIGAGLSIFAAILMLVGTFQQAKKDAFFQKNVGGYVDEQKESDIPNLVGLKITGSSPNYSLLVKNIGNKPANKVKLIFKENSAPNIFAANIISGAGEIPQGTEYTLPLNLFSGIGLIMKLPNSEPEYVENLKESLEKFNSGRIAFIPRFYLEYYMGDRKFVSEEYYLVIDNINGGSFYFGKEEEKNN